MLTVYTLVIIWQLGGRGAVSTVVPNLPTQAACEQLQRDLTARSMGYRAQCVVTVMPGVREP